MLYIGVQSLITAREAVTEGFVLSKLLIHTGDSLLGATLIGEDLSGVHS